MKQTGSVKRQAGNGKAGNGRNAELIPHPGLSFLCGNQLHRGESVEDCEKACARNVSLRFTIHERRFTFYDLFIQRIHQVGVGLSHAFDSMDASQD